MIARMTWLYMLQHKDDVLSVFRSFHAMIQTQFSTKINILCSDNGGEYVNKEFQAYFQLHGHIHETSMLKHHNKMGLWNGSIDIS